MASYGYDEQVYEPLMQGNVNYQYDMSQPGADEELKRLQALLRGGAPDQGVPAVGLSEAVQQEEARNTATRALYPEVMPDMPQGGQEANAGWRSTSNTFADAVGPNSQPGGIQGYQGPMAAADKMPYKYGPYTATPSGIDPGQMEKVNQSVLPGYKPGGPVKTVGDLRNLVAQMQGVDKDVIEGVVAGLTGIDRESQKQQAIGSREKDVAGFKGDTAANKARELDITARNAEVAADARRDVARAGLYSKMDDVIKSLGTQLANPLYKNQDPNGWLATRNIYHNLLNLMAQGGFGFKPQPSPAAGGAPSVTGSRTYTLPGGVTVTSNPDKTQGAPVAAPAGTPAPTATPQPAPQPQSYPVTQGGPAAGSFGGTPEAQRFHNQAQEQARDFALAQQLARSAGYNPRNPPQKFIDEAKRRRILEAAQQRMGR